MLVGESNTWRIFVQTMKSFLAKLWSARIVNQYLRRNFRFFPELPRVRNVFQRCIVHSYYMIGQVGADVFHQDGADSGIFAGKKIEFDMVDAKQVTIGFCSRAGGACALRDQANFTKNVATAQGADGAAFFRVDVNHTRQQNIHIVARVAFIEDGFTLCKVGSFA